MDSPGVVVTVRAVNHPGSDNNAEVVAGSGHGPRGSGRCSGVRPAARYCRTKHATLLDVPVIRANTEPDCLGSSHVERP